MKLILGLVVLIINHQVCTGNDDSLSRIAVPLPYQTPNEHLLAYYSSTETPAAAIDVAAELKHLNSTYICDRDWPKPEPTVRLGTVSAVAFDLEGNVVVFHRADRVWNEHTFNGSNHYTGANREPISAPTLIAYTRHDGKVAYKTGENLFLMPHGLTIDGDGSFYITDVALHQVFKFRRSGTSLTLEWVMGERLLPKTYCKPTSVAVLPNGDFFVADGYCHAKIIKYSKDRKQLTAWGINAFAGNALPVAPPYYFAVPHSLTVAGDLGLLCVADRENGRVQCFDYDGKFESQFHSPVIGDRLFSVAYLPKNGGQLFVVNGPSLSEAAVEIAGFVIDMTTSRIVSKFTPSKSEFLNPHDIIVSNDGIEVYVANLFPDKVYKLLSSDVQSYNTSLPDSINAHTPHKQLTEAAADATMVMTSSSLRMELLVVSVLTLFGCIALLVAYTVWRRRTTGSSSTSASLEYRQLMTEAPTADE